MRGRVSARRAAPPGPTTTDALSDADVTSEALLEIRDRIDRFNVSGLLVASRDGLVLCGDTQDIENGSVAAMAAAAVGLATQFTGQAKLGEPHAAMFEGSLGHVCVFPVEQTILLVVFGRQGTTMGMFNVAARQALAELHQAIARQRERSLRAGSAVPATQQSPVEAQGRSQNG
jgi:predicted regulator of Ras-like GTPase activity (Roadblock/LC7/MglB family)